MITALAPTKRDPSRITIKVNGKAVATMVRARIEELALHEGMAWDDALAQRVQQAAAVDKAMRDAMTRLSRRMLSSGDMRRKLRQRDHDAPVIDEALERLEALDLIDDEAFGRALIAETLRRKPAGPKLLRSKLMQKGLDRELIDRLLAELTPVGDDAVHGAVELIEKKLRSMGNLDENTRKRRLWGMLARRGFEADVIEQAMRQIDDV